MNFNLKNCLLENKKKIDLFLKGLNKHEYYLLDLLSVLLMYY